MKKKLFILGGTLLIVTLALNIKTSLNQTKLSDKPLSAFLNTAMALPESTNDGSIADNTDCMETVKVYNDSFDPSKFIWVDVEGHETDCVFNWPDLGCDDHDCELNKYAY